MTPEDLRRLPEDRAVILPPLLYALWLDAHCHWKRAHEIAQDIHTPAAASVHGYLHRCEGDLSNARYWYRQAHQPEPNCSLEAEWDNLVSRFIREEQITS